MKTILAILFLVVLCSGWVLVQMLAKKMKTKNHFEHLNSACGHCTCGGIFEQCENDIDSSRAAVEQIK